MSDPSNINIDVGPPPEILRQRGSFRFLKILVLLAVIGGSGVVIWLNRDRFSDSSKSDTSDIANSQPGSGSDESTSTKDATSVSQQNATAIRSLTDSMAVQQGDIRKLSDRMDDLANRVAALTSKVYLLQAGDPGAAAPGAAVSGVAAPGAAAPAPTRPVATAARKKPAPAPKPAGAISVGGAPLPPAPER